MAYQKVIISGINTSKLTVLKESEKIELLREIQRTGSKEARDAGFIRPDGNSRILKKVLDTEKGTLTFQVDWEAEENRTDL